MTSSLVEIRKLNHRYGRIAALTNVDLLLPEGGLIGIVGPDGVGKSTLLSLIAGVTKIQDGSINVFGSSLAKNSLRTDVRSRIGFMPPYSLQP